MDIIFKYFKDLNEDQKSKLEKLEGLYREWNAQINVVSRKDIDHLYEHHVLHSMAIAKYVRFKSGSKVMDLGSGGGFPGIPLAILFPDVHFTLVDSIGKKMKVAKAVADGLGLTNVTCLNSRAEQVGEKFDFVVCRAVAPLVELLPWCRKVLSKQHNNAIPNGLIALKGGNLQEEVKALGRGEYAEIVLLSKYYKEEFFKEKGVVYVQG